jgi:putative membrane protein
MGLILVFRVNSSYDKWWEARKIWGNVVNQSRNLAIILLNYTKPKDPQWTIKVTNYIAAFPYLMKNNLRGRSSVKEIKHLLNPKDLALIEDAEHKPNALSDLIAKELQHILVHQEIDSFAFLQAEEKREFILDCQGACERILKTPIPFVMAIKSRRFIFLFLLVLPFALSHVSIYISPVVSGLVSYALFSLDQIGVELQNPFSENRLSHLPLDVICASIENNIKEIQGM